MENYPNAFKSAVEIALPAKLKPLVEENLHGISFRIKIRPIPIEIHDFSDMKMIKSNEQLFEFSVIQKMARKGNKKETEGFNLGGGSIQQDTRLGIANIFKEINEFIEEKFTEWTKKYKEQNEA
jgi:hypothetical protein